MKPDPVEQELRELAWRPQLTEAQRARLAEWLAQHPAARAEWEDDAALSAALSRTLAKPPPSNLTARILAEVDQANPAATAMGATPLWRRLFGWAPRIAVAVVLLGGGAFLYHQHRLEQAAVAQQAEALAQLAKLTEPKAMPSVEALENFDVILKIHPAPLADTELLSMSKQLAEFKP